MRASENAFSVTTEDSYKQVTSAPVVWGSQLAVISMSNDNRTGLAGIANAFLYWYCLSLCCFFFL